MSEVHRYRVEAAGLTATTNSRSVAVAMASDRSEKGEVSILHERATDDGWITLGSAIYSRGKERLSTGTLAPPRNPPNPAPQRFQMRGGMR